MHIKKNNDYVVTIKNVTKNYQIYNHNFDRLKQYIYEFINKPPFKAPC